MLEPAWACQLQLLSQLAPDQLTLIPDSTPKFASPPISVCLLAHQDPQSPIVSGGAAMSLALLETIGTTHEVCVSSLVSQGYFYTLHLVGIVSCRA